MPRKRNPNRDKAFEIWKKSRGKKTPQQIAEELGEPAKAVREWKSKDKWEQNRPHKGGQKGNRNAKGHGAPKGNQNAEKHGAYSMPRMQNWSEDERRIIEETTLDYAELAHSQLKRLMAKQHDLERKISEIENAEDELFLDGTMTMKMPGGGDMEYITKSGKFKRLTILEAELNKVHGRIQKAIDSIRAAEESKDRMKFEREKFEFARQKALGQFDIDEEIDGEEDSTAEVVEE